MEKSSKKRVVCPVQYKQCEWLLEVKSLRKEVSELSELVSTDPLTGLYNFRFFSQMMKLEMERTRRNAMPTCMVMVDLDHFKNINDTWGHEVGNIALKLAADIFKQQVRSTDFVCRYGGEEFAIILPETHLRMALPVAERIRLAIEQTPVVFENGHFSFTASMGANVYTATSEQDITAFVASVDQYLYQAKEGGRNQIGYPSELDVKPSDGVTDEERDGLLGK